MGRIDVKKFRTVKAMQEAWEQYKEECDNKTVLTHEFSAKNSEFVSANLKRSVTYTFKGFALFCGMTEQNFFATYRNDPKFESVIARMREECEIDAREKFELGCIDPKLAGLWMSNYGYSTKTEATDDITLSEAKRYWMV